MDTSNKSIALKNLIYEFLIILLTTMAAFLTSYLFQKPLNEILRNVILAFMGSSLVVISLIIGIQTNSLLHDNTEHIQRFFSFYMVGLIFLCILDFLPVKIWPVIILAICFTLTTNMICGICTYTVFILLASVFSGNHLYISFCYLFAGLIAMLLFLQIDDSFHFLPPLIISLLMLFVLETAFIIIFEEQSVNLDVFALPLMNVFISLILILIFLKYYSSFIVHKYRDKYQEINDPDYFLLSQFKEENHAEYYHAIHTAYFCDKVSRKIGTNSLLSKAGGYFHHIGMLEKNKENEATISIAIKNQFPPQLIQLLKEYGDKNTPLVSKEAAIVCLCDSVVTSISYLFKKDNKVQLDYLKLVDAVFQKKMESGILMNCALTLEEYYAIKQVLGEEKLYYDFLR